MLHLMDGSYVGSLLEFLSNCQLKLFHALRAKIESEIFEELVGTPECDFTNFFQVSSSRFTLFPFPVIVSASYSQFCQTVAEIRWKINPSISRIFWSGWFTLLQSVVWKNKTRTSQRKVMQICFLRSVFKEFYFKD